MPDVRSQLFFQWNDPASLDSIQRCTEAAHSVCAPIAGWYCRRLDVGVGAATAKPRLDVVIRNAINAVDSGATLHRASQEMTVKGGWVTNPSLFPQPEFKFGRSSRPGKVRRACASSQVRVDQIKLTLSGEYIRDYSRVHDIFRRINCELRTRS